MKHESINRSSVRELDIAEIALVAGGLSYEGDGYTSEDEEDGDSADSGWWGQATVNGHPAAAAAAYSLASVEINMLYYSGIALSAAAAYVYQGISAAIGISVGATAAGDLRDAAIEALAEVYYDLDGADGVYDGISDYHRHTNTNPW